MYVKVAHPSFIERRVETGPGNEFMTVEDPLGYCEVVKGFPYWSVCGHLACTFILRSITFGKSRKINHPRKPIPFTYAGSQKVLGRSG